MAYIASPIWFFIVSALFALLLLTVTVVSFGVLLPWTGPLMTALGLYLSLIPIWVVSTWVLTITPLLLSCALLPLFDPEARRYVNPRVIGIQKIAARA
jgi:hypothetical protein